MGPFEDNQQMIEDIGGLGDEAGAVALRGRDHGFDGLFAELLRRLRRASGEELSRVGLIRRRLGSFRDDAGEIGEGEGLAHNSASIRIASPARAIWAFACAIEYSPKWKIDAASTALAWPSRTPSTR